MKHQFLKIALLLLCAGMIRAQDVARTLMPGDILMLRVAEELEMTQRITVPADGKITYWLLDPIVVTNKSVAQIRQVLYEMLDKDFIINPAISVEVEVYSKQFVNLTGQFLEPGRKELPVDRKVDIMDVISMGRGFSPKANKNQIILRRKNQTITYSKKQLDTMYEKGERVVIEPDDNIEVKESVL